MLTLRKVYKSDFDNFEPIDMQAIEFLNYFAINFEEDQPHNFAFECDGEIVLLISLREMWPGVYDSFTIFSKHWRPVFYKSVSRAAKNYLKNINYDRIQHLVSCERPWTHKMAKMFGMKCETPDGMDKYVSGEKRYMYAIVS